MTPEEIINLLVSTSDRIFDGDDEDDVVINTELFYPRINIYNAIVAVKNQLPLEPMNLLSGDNLSGDLSLESDSPSGIDLV